jgi:hypothetical protein
MKKNLIYAVMLLLGFTACRKTVVENAFYAQPEQRMADTLNFIRKALTDAEYGWKGGFETGSKGGFGFYFQFDKDQNVTMLSDYSTASGTDLKKSTYRVSPTNSPSLLFDTYNYISVMQDPVPGVAGGTAGQGYKSDIEFIYKGHSGDSLFFSGKKYNYLLTLVKASQIEQQSYLNNGINAYRTAFGNVYNNKYAYSYLTGESKLNLSVEIDYTSRTIVFASADENRDLKNITTVPFYVTATALNLVKPHYVAYNGKSINSIIYNGDQVLAVYTDGGTVVLSSQNTPLYSLDLTFDYNKYFKKIVAGNTIPGVTATSPVFDEIKQAFTTSGRMVTNMYFAFTNSTTAVFNVSYYSGTPPNQSNFTAQAIFTYRRNAAQLFLKRTSVDPNNNWNVRSVELAAANTLFGTGDEREFVLDWAVSSDKSIKFPVGAIKSKANINSMLYGRLSE